ncbi:MAG: rhomboid family intramembrane serine protease [Phycisphaeraceae bacterium]|nr:rhomboid family intramembrane serine protease [Phycisphaeraceae bacterium]MCW5753366.1 rhomboid family intramembrane serine protease [Phycisphaeraceae bacterium]
MIIPLGTDRPLSRSPKVTSWLIAANVLVAIGMLLLARFDAQRAENVIQMFAVWGGDFKVHTLLTSAFLHGGFLHLLFNMLTLWVFGPNVEDRLGRLGYLGLYGAGAAASGGLHAAFEDAAAIGASGAIAAVVGAYLVLFPRTQVRVLFFFIIIGVFSIPAWWFIAAAIAKDLLAQGLGQQNGIANLAHLGGYGFGFTTAWLLLATGRLSREPYDLFTVVRQSRRRSALRDAQFHAQAQKTRLEREAQRVAESGRADARIEAVSQARRRVVERLSRRDLDGAAAGYRALIEEFGRDAGTLGSQHMIELGKHYYAAGDYEMSVLVYERFLAAYPLDIEAASVRLLLGVLHARYLNDPVRAKVLLSEARDLGLDEEHDALAAQLLRDLG